VMPFSADTDVLIDALAEAILSSGLAVAGDRIAITAGRSSRTSGGTDFILVRTL
jgi:pyruvate kinase